MIKPFPQQTRGGRFAPAGLRRKTKLAALAVHVHAHGVQAPPSDRGRARRWSGRRCAPGARLVVPGGQGGGLADGGDVERRADAVQVARPARPTSRSRSPARMPARSVGLEKVRPRNPGACPQAFSSSEGVEGPRWYSAIGLRRRRHYGRARRRSARISADGSTPLSGVAGRVVGVHSTSSLGLLGGLDLEGLDARGRSRAVRGTVDECRLAQPPKIA